MTTLDEALAAALAAPTLDHLWIYLDEEEPGTEFDPGEDWPPGSPTVEGRSDHGSHVPSDARSTDYGPSTALTTVASASRPPSLDG